jgi:hypothetical protein
VSDSTDATRDQGAPLYGKPVTPPYGDPVAPPYAGPLSQPERVGRGLALALVVIPAGVAVWTILWNIGFVSSIVSFGVAIAAVWLYRTGSRARVTRTAFWGIVAIIVVTIILSFLAGIFTDLVRDVRIPFGQALTDARFWRLFSDNVFHNADLWKSYLPQVLFALLFAALGCFRTLRRISRESRV